MRKFNALQGNSALISTLLFDVEMDYELYQYEIEEHIEEFTKDLHKDKDEFVEVITERTGSVAIALKTKGNQLFINEKAKGKLKE